MLATGYIYNLIDNKLNFEQFVCNCARAFGALIHMRDDDMNIEIKEAKADGYYVNLLKDSTKKLKKLEKMTKEEKIAFGQEKIDWYLNFYKKEMKKEKEDLQTIEEMKKLVEAWEPPSEDHKPLKAFMLQQLGDVTFHSDYEEDIERISKKTPIDYYNEALDLCRTDIEQSKKETIKEVKNVQSQNEWVKTLLSSLR